MLRILFAKRRAPVRWIAAVLALVALLFVGHAFEDGGVASGVPYILIVLFCALYLVRPMVILWAPVFAAFVCYAALVLVDPLVHPSNGPRGEWAIFLLLGVVPAILLWVARPRTFGDARETLESGGGA